MLSENKFIYSMLEILQKKNENLNSAIWLIAPKTSGRAIRLLQVYLMKKALQFVIAVHIE